MHTADDTPSKNAAARSKLCNFTCQRDARPRVAAQGPGQLQGRTGTGQHKPLRQQRGLRPDGNAASDTASVLSDPDHTRKRSSCKRETATELSRPGIHCGSNRCSMWRHLCSLAA